MDFMVPITGSSVLAGISIVIWYFAKERITEAKLKREANEKLLHEHVKACNEKHINHARLEENVKRIDGKVDDLKEVIKERSGKIDGMDDKIDRMIEMMITSRSTQ